MNWTNFQTYNDAPTKAFEILCNQLFENWCKEQYPSEMASFNVVNGSGGDGGVESYAVLSDGKVIGLQAKWFPDSITTNQMGQIKNSINTALKMRPQITRYIVCVPRDLASLTGKGDNTEDKRWEDMKSDVLKDNPNLTLDLWNETRLTQELQKECSAGIFKFWFERAEISEESVKFSFEKSKHMGVIRDSLNRFISLQGYTIDFAALEQICYALITLYMFLGTNGKAISKADYEKRITEWLVSSANGGMKRKGNYSELELKVVQDDSLSNIGTSIPFSRIKTLLKYRDSVLTTGASLIRQIQKIKLPAFEDCREVKRCDPDKIRKYVKGDLPDFDFGDFPKYKRSELSEDEKIRKKDEIRKYWSISVEEDFFNVGNLSESNLLTSLTGQVDYNGLDIEKCKNSLIYELIGKILILKCIDRTTDILQNVHLVPLCIVNTSDVSDKDISVSLIVHNDGFRPFSLTSEVKGDDKIMLDAMADTLIEEEILEIVLKIDATSNISLEPEKWSPAVPFVMPNPFGGRRMYDFDDLVIEWSKFQAEVATNGMVTYEFSTLRPGEAKWLSPYLMIVPTAESFPLEYTILSESSGSKKNGTVEIHVNN